MAILLVDHKGQHRAAILPARVLIGRRSMNNLVIEDPAISRMHAWIDRQGNASYLTDMRSRTGTRINGRPATLRQQLHDGDIIEIGPVRLRFFESDVIPGGIEWLEIPAEATLTERDPGIRFDCPHCQAPMWAAPQFAGHKGECTYCGKPFLVPQPGEHAKLIPAVSRHETATVSVASGNGHSHAATSVAALPSRISEGAQLSDQDVGRKSAIKCGVCQSNILPLESNTICPSCGLHFHEECWQENYGCSAYGCSQVNILKPPEVEAQEQAAAEAEAAAAIADEEPPPRTPWEFILLGVSAVAVIISAVSFGGASLLTFLASIGLFFRSRGDPRRKSGALFGAVALSVVGIAAGAGVSYFLFVYGRK
jgi:hypothetical protein